MTPEELLTPRFKVIANYPNSPFKIGDILIQKINKPNTFLVEGRTYNDRYPDNYPAIFREMNWWEERDINDMPEYVKKAYKDTFYKIEKWHSHNTMCRIVDKPYSGYVQSFIPATEEEYNAQNKSK